MIDVSQYFSKIPQSVLVSGTNIGRISYFVDEWCAQLLKTTVEMVVKHPDFHAIYPVNKMRQINVDILRDFNRNVYVSSQQGGRKVFVIHEADRLNMAAANALLKTLEEPTHDTSIFLVTVRPYDLLPTLRSRCWWVQINGDSEKEKLIDMQDWFHQLRELVWNYSIDQQAISPIKIYGLLYQLQNFVDNQREVVEVVDSDLDEEVKIAQKAGVEKQFIKEVFEKIELTLGEMVQQAPDNVILRELYANWIGQLELCFGRIEVNLGAITALEPFLLQFCK